MGTVVTFDLLVGPKCPPDDMARRLASARATLHRADAVFSTWRVDSPLNRLRRGEVPLEQCPIEVQQVLTACENVRAITHGWFDPWAMPGGVDPTGYVKGWAAKCALDALISPDLVGALVNAAGDIAVYGTQSSGMPLRIGIVDPHAPRQLACVVEPGGAIATSGTYERGAHLIDPRTQRPSARVASASVTGPDLGMADALATALAVGGEEVFELIEEIEGYDALIITFNATQRWTKHFPRVDPE